MASKTIDSGITREYQLHLIMSEQSQSVANNTTTIVYELRLTSGSYSFGQYGAGWEVWINGSRVAYHDRAGSERYSIGVNSSWTIASGTTTVAHNTDGTKTINCSASLDMGGSPAPGALSCPETSWTLTTIPRASTMTIPTMTIGSSCTFNISMASSSFSHSITYTFGALSGTAGTASAGVSTISWTPPNSFYAETPYSDSAYITLVLHTFSGSTEVGSKTYDYQIVYVPASVKPTAPTVTLTPVNSNTWINSKGLYVGGYSKVKIDSSASPGTGSYISGYTITNDVQGSGASYTSGVLTEGTKTISVTVADTRGRTNFTTVYVYFKPYSSPTLKLSAQRGTYSNGTWSANTSGDHIRVTATPTVSLASDGNTGTVTVKIGNTSPAATSGNYYYFTNTVATSKYTVSGSITDSVGNSGSASLSVAVTAVASTMTYGTLNIGSSVTFTISRNNSNFTHTITASLGSQSATVGTGIGTSTSWTIPSAWFSEIPNATSMNGTFVLKTYRGSTKVGENSYTGSFKVPSSVKPSVPSITLSPVNTNAWFSSNNLYVGGYTKLKVQSSATAGSGATLSSLSVTGAFTATGSNVTSNILTAGAKTVTVTATDSRGRTNSNSASVTFLTYTNPSITTFTAERGTYSGGAWTSDDNGDHIRITAIPSVALSAQGNTATVTVKIGATNPDATSGNYYYFTSTSATTSYAVTGTITDSVGNSSSRGLTVPTISVPLNINVDLPGIGAGMIAQKAKTVEIAQDWRLVANGKNNQFNYLPYSFNAYGTSGTAGYLRIATITITGNSISQPIEFDIQRRLDGRTVRLYVLFNNEGNTDPALSSFYYDSYAGTAGNKPEAFILKSATSVWEVYVRKSANSDNVGIYTLMPAHAQDRCDITYSQYQVSSIPSGAVMATAVPLLTATPTITKTSGNCSLLNTGFAREGRVCQLYLRFRVDSDTTPSSTNIFVGTVSGIPLPVWNAKSVDYTGRDVYIFTLSSTGEVSLHLSGTDTAYTGSTPITSIVYLTNSDI